MEKLCEMIERSTEQTFGLFCTFILYSDIIAEENKSRYNMPILIRKKGNTSVFNA